MKPNSIYFDQKESEKHVKIKSKKFGIIISCKSMIESKLAQSNISISIDGEYLNNSLFRKRRIISQDFEMF